MINTTDSLNNTLKTLLDAIQDNISLLVKTSDINEKQSLANVIKSLSESQKNLTESINLLYNEDFGFMDDDFFEDNRCEEDDNELNDLMDTKQISFKKKKTCKKNDNKVKKLEDEDSLF